MMSAAPNAWLRQLLALCFIFMAFSCSSAVAAASRTGLDQFLKSYCLNCHGAEKPKGDYTLTPLIGQPVKNKISDWQNVLERLVEQDMPPHKEKTVPRPKAAEYDEITDWLKHELLVAIGNTGRPARRLNRAEYNNTMRDLLLIDACPAGGFPQDLGKEGFDNVAEAQSISPLLIEKYMRAARESLEMAIASGPEPRRLDFQYFPLSRNQKEGKAPVKATPTGVEQLIGKKPNEIEKQNLRIMSMDYGSFSGQDGNGSVREGKGLHGYEVVLPHDNRGRRVQVEFKNELPLGRYKAIVYAYATPAKDKQGNDVPRSGACVMGVDVNTERTTERDVEVGTEPRPYEFEFVTDRQKSMIAFASASAPNKKDMAGIPNLVVCWAELKGPLYDKWPPPSHRAIFGEDGTWTIEQILRNFITRAFRRPAQPGEIAQYKAIADAELAAGAKLPAAVAVALQAVLVSPNFLYIVEESRPKGELSDYEVASRLSYFLWSSMPDAELFALAEKKQLKKPDVLRAQLVRMLRDPKAEALVDNFAGQWTGIRRLLDIAPDPTVFKDWDEGLRRSMREETEHFFRHIMRDNLSLLNFLDSDFTFVNERLAKHYGIPGVTGSGLQKVALKPEYNRGGLLVQGGILTLNSQPTRSSPIFRGKFVVEKLFNRPPPNPPADVPPLQEDVAGKTPKNLREQLALHAANPTCAACHEKIDPWGLPMESYNGIGAWRELTVDDLTAKLDTGKTIVGPQALKAALVERKNDFVRGLTEKLLLYSLGRGLDLRDKKHIPAIIEQVAKREYHFQELIAAIVTSPPFLSR